MLIIRHGKQQLLDLYKLLKLIKTASDKNDIIKILKTNNIKFIGCGSTRLVIERDENTVFKIAINNYGIAANIQEFILSKIDKTEKYSKVFYKTKKSTILICEKCKEIGKTQYGINRNGKKVLLDYSNIGID